MVNIKTTICAVMGGIGSYIAYIFGGWDKDMTTLIIFMAIDFLMGLVIAFVFRNSPKSVNGGIASKPCFEGLCKKCVMLLFVLVAHRLDVSLGVSYIKTATVIGFIVNEAISVMENAGLMGLPLPKVITKAIDILKSGEDDEEYM